MIRHFAFSKNNNKTRHYITYQITRFYYRFPGEETE